MTFNEWLGEPQLCVSTTYEFDQWYATAEDFCIVGVGQDEPSAITEMFELVEVYLRSFYRDGSAYGATLRPAGLGWKFRWLRKRLRGAGHRYRLGLPFA